jgi:glucose-6-phosphate isomerase
MEDLAGTSGLPLWLNTQEHVLVLTQPGANLEAEPQPLQNLRRVLHDAAVQEPAIPDWVYHDVLLPTDEGVFHEHGVRHSLWLLRAGRLGKEYIKTWGHVAICTDGLMCPEAYGVLYGWALFLLQQTVERPQDAPSSPQVRDVRRIEASPGQKVVVPAGYGVVVANVGAGELVLASLASANAWPVHRTFEQTHGAAYYVLAREGAVVLEANPRYAQPLPPVHEDAPLQAPELGISDQEPLYSALVHRPERFAWLQEGAPSLEGVC